MLSRWLIERKATLGDGVRFTNDSKSCPADERARSLLVQEMIGDFRQLMQKKRLTGLIYYSWLGEVRFDVYRCGLLTKTGQLAISPITAH